ncbi:hypothetical protein B0H66DRAFT_599096 [Apodospora peruviana]|uniref:Uncharacterized protein n=1 Tax=Apodospora peruviana TaxID=516989 RepID=A0AAE0IIE9_9PEZI|nr:hypothetical protein B0H66DRAFT_599096 [Apodospora peruviana]
MDVVCQLIDHQTTLDILAAGLPVRLPRGKLEGYRFMEVATRRSITPRVVHLREFEGAGKSWVDLIRALRAVTLFGEDFGNLIAPRPEAATTDTASSSTNQVATLCNRWRTVPKDRDYLAASSYDLARILRQEGSAACNPMKLAPGIFWSQSATAFERCACESRGGGNKNDAFLRAFALLRRPCDRVQCALDESQKIRLTDLAGRIDLTYASCESKLDVLLAGFAKLRHDIDHGRLRRADIGHEHSKARLAGREGDNTMLGVGFSRGEQDSETLRKHLSAV